MNLRRTLTLSGSLAAVLALGACNDYPVHRLLDSFEARVTTGLSNTSAVKLDFLWVIDHSPSMCQEQVELASGFQGFVTELNSLGGIDAQMAVVTVQQVPDVGEPIIVKQVGQFMHTPATSFPPNCTERTRLPCVSNSQCVNQFTFTFEPNANTCSSLCPTGGKGTYENEIKTGGVGWQCKAMSDKKFTANDNCSINSYCQWRCNNDQECRDLFEPTVPANQQRIKCYKPGGTGGTDAFCQYPPSTADCPTADKLPPVLKQSEKFCKQGKDKKFYRLDGKECSSDEKKQSDAGKLTELEWFRCNATVGASQSKQSSFEGGFRSAWHALDPGRGLVDKNMESGANCPRDPKTGKMDPVKCQYKQLVRDDAYLIIVFVSDDDDCSVNLSIPLKNGTQAEKDQLKKDVPSELWDTCQRYPDAIAGNVELTEGHCEYRKSKDPKIVCPADCLKLAVGTQERIDCDAGAAVSMEDSRKQLFGQLGAFNTTSALFTPVAEYVNRFRSLKSDPARVIVATITGDTLVKAAKDAKDAKAAEQQRHCDRVSYYRSLFRNVAPGQAPYVCEGKRGESGYGSRYVQLVDAFRENGVMFNICEGSSFGPALKEFATAIKRRTKKVCLPHPPGYKTGTPLLKIERVRNKVATPLTYVADPTSKAKDSYYIKASPDCRKEGGEVLGEGLACATTRDCAGGLRCIKEQGKEEGLCKVYAEAIYFTEVLEQGDDIQLNYAADLGL
jgi:hypothetical protein